MITQTDAYFILFSIIVIATGYYFLVVRKAEAAKPVIREVPFRRPDRGNLELSDPDDKDDDRPKTKAELLKEARKREKKAQKEANRQAIEARKKAQEEMEARLEEEEEKRKEELAKEHEEEEKIEAEKRRKEEEEYNQWKDLLTVESEGNQIDEQKSNENLLANFLEFIRVG